MSYKKLTTLFVFSIDHIWFQFLDLVKTMYSVDSLKLDAFRVIKLVAANGRNGQKYSSRAVYWFHLHGFV